MPKAIYTATKGLIQSGDTDSGFSISGAPIIIGAQDVELKQIKYTIDCTNLAAAAEEATTTTYQNESFVLVDAAGTSHTFFFECAEAGTGNIPPSTLAGEEAINFADTDGKAALITDIKNAIDGVATFNAAVSGDTVLVYSLNPGFLSDGDKDTIEAQTPADTLITIAASSVGEISRVAGYINADRNINKAAPTSNQIHGAGLSCVTLESDNSDAAVQLAFADGSVKGHEKYIYNAASNSIILTGAFQDGATTGNALTLGTGVVEWLLWNGSRWYLAKSSGSVSTI